MPLPEVANVTGGVKGGGLLNEVSLVVDQYQSNYSHG